MALTTQCPHCQTTFKVVHDQLKLRAGLVRCGSCKQIFNGIEHLVRPEEAAPSPPVAPADKPAVAPTPITAAAPPASTPAAAEPMHEDIAPLTQPPANPVDFVALDTLGTLDDTPPSTVDQAATPPAQALPTPAAPDKKIAASDSKDAGSNETEEEDDPLQRMTLVDFSAFDEEDTLPQEPAPSPDAKLAPPLAESPAAAPSAPAPAMPAAAVPPGAETVRGAPVAIPPAHPAPPETETPLDKGDEIGEEPAADDAAPALAADTHTEAEADITGISQAARHGDETSAADTTDAADIEDGDDTEDSEVEDEIEEPGFVTHARKKQRRSRILRLVLAFGSIFLLLGAIAQGAYAFRNQLAAWFPETKPFLIQFCEAIGCRVQLPSQIDMVSIESHELQALAIDQNTFALTLLLRNRSLVTQAWPDIELTLNDSEEKPLVRRVLKPAEYLASPAEAALGFAPQSEQSVKVSFELKQVKASGYRVYLFYP